MHNEHSHEHLPEKDTSYIPMVIIVIFLGFLAWLLLHNYEGKGYMWGNATSTHSGHEGHEGKPAHEASVFLNPAELGSLDTTSGNFIYNTGAGTEILLPDSVKLSVGANSSEAKLVAFLSDASKTVNAEDKTQGWISLDRLYFETGKSTLTTESKQQLSNIAAILKAFPNANLKLGGYTDNTGTPDGNLKLSDSRAKSAQASLGGLGVAAGRLEAEGYGQEHPIADNATAEGRALNRRIDLRVIKK